MTPVESEQSTRTYVYDFTEGNKDLKDLLGGKGANLAEMTNLGLPVPPGFTITTEACRAYLERGRHPGGAATTRSAAHLATLEKAMGRKLGDPGDPLLVSRAVRGEVLDARDDGDGPEHRAERRVSVHGPGGQQSGNERFAWDSYRRLIQMFGKTVLRHRRRAVRARARRGQEGARASTDDLDLDADDLRGAGRRRSRRSSASTPAATSRRTRASSWTWPSTRCSTRGTPTARDALPPPGAHPDRPGHRGQHRGDGVRQPRHGLRHRRRVHPRPGHRRAGRLRRLPAERPGRGRGRRHPQHGAARRSWRSIDKSVLRRAAADHGDAGEALPGPVRHRVHHRARQAVDAADPGRQADRGGRVPHRHAAGRRGPDRHRRGGAPGHRRPAGPADVPAVRRRRRRRASSPRA